MLRAGSTQGSSFFFIFPWAIRKTKMKRSEWQRKRMLCSQVTMSENFPKCSIIYDWNFDEISNLNLNYRYMERSIFSLYGTLWNLSNYIIFVIEISWNSIILLKLHVPKTFWNFETLIETFGIISLQKYLGLIVISRH